MKMNKTILFSILFVAVSLFMFTTVSKSGAWFSSYRELDGGANLRLSHETTIIEQIDDGNKTIEVYNSGETDVVVRLQIFGGSFVNIEAGKDWTKSGDWYYYNKVLKAGEYSDRGNDGAGIIKATVIGDGTPDFDFDVIVIVEAERAVYDGQQLIAPLETWDIEYPVSGQGGNA